MLKEFNKYLDGGLSQKEPSKSFLKDVRTALFNIHAISFMAGQYWVKLKTEIDKETLDEIKKSKSLSENIEDISTLDYVDYAAHVLYFANVPKKDFIKNIAPVSAIKFLADKLGVKVKSYLEKIEAAIGDKIDIATKLSFYDNAKHLTRFIQGALKTGESYQSAIRRLGKQDLLDKIGITDNNKYYLETVVRTNEITAMSAGDRIESLASENVEFYQYIAILDPRTTDVCKSLDEIVLKKDDPLWATHLPPNHFNCRSRVITMSGDLAAQLNMKVSSKKGIEQPEENFNVDPSKTWSLPTKDMRQRLADHLGVDYKDIPKGAQFKP